MTDLKDIDAALYSFNEVVCDDTAAVFMNDHQDIILAALEHYKNSADVANKALGGGG